MEKHTEDHGRPDAGGGKELERIVFFSDAVFAIAITLLVLDIKVPELHGDVAAQLPGAIFAQTPQLASFLISFFVIALYWTSHHRMFRLVRRYDGMLITLNTLLLLFIAFMPIPSAYLGAYGNVPLVTALYAIFLIGLSLVDLALWIYAARRHRLIDGHVKPRMIAYYTVRLVIPIGIFALSIPVSFFISPSLAEMSWALMIPAHLLMRRHYRDILSNVYSDD